jgi:hypothetical protein
MSSKTDYTVTMSDGTEWTMRADLAQASAPIHSVTVDRDGESVETLPYQTADARHRPMRAAELAVAYWARQGGEDMGAVESVEVAS